MMMWMNPNLRRAFFCHSEARSAEEPACCRPCGSDDSRLDGRMNLCLGCDTPGYTSGILTGIIRADRVRDSRFLCAARLRNDKRERVSGPGYSPSGHCLCISPATSAMISIHETGEKHHAGNRTAVYSASFRVRRRERSAAHAAGHTREACRSDQGKEKRAVDEASGAGEMVGGGNPCPLCGRGNRDLMAAAANPEQRRRRDPGLRSGFMGGDFQLCPP